MKPVEDLAGALKYVDYLIPNDEEAMLLTGEESVEAAAGRLREAGAGAVVIKCGGQRLLHGQCRREVLDPGGGKT